VLIASTPIKVATVKATKDGGYWVRVQIPASVPAGQHHVIVRTTDDGKPAFYANTVRVQAAPTVKPAPRVDCTKTATNSCAQQAAATRRFYKGVPFPGPLRRGSKGKAVVMVQQVLNVTPDSGRYRRRTERAVRAFQRFVHLPVTGKVDQRTWKAIFG